MFGFADVMRKLIGSRRCERREREREKKILIFFVSLLFSFSFFVIKQRNAPDSINLPFTFQFFFVQEDMPA
jgi:hypothetical protein